MTEEDIKNGADEAVGMILNDMEHRHGFREVLDQAEGATKDEIRRWWTDLIVLTMTRRMPPSKPSKEG